MKKEILVLLDVQNIFYGSLNYSQGQRQIDYNELLYVIEDELKKYFDYKENTARNRDEGIELELDPYAYVVQTPRYDGTALFALLRSLGYALRSKAYLEDAIVYDADVADNDWRGTVGSLIQMDLLDMGPDYDDVVVVSGSGVFEKAFRAMRAHWPDVTRHICAFDNTLHDVYTNPGIVDNVIHLDQRVLRDRNVRKTS